MKKTVLLVACAVLTVVASGSALAAVVTCTGGRSEGTSEPDQITGTDQRDRIFALAGQDDVRAMADQDELNGGDFLTGQTQNDTYYGRRGDDVLRGQGGSEHFPNAPQEPTMFGDPGDDELYGGDNNDYLDAANDDDPEYPSDLVECGRGSDDTAVVWPNDIVRRNCENVIEVTTARTAPGTSGEEQQRQSETLLQKLGG